MILPRLKQDVALLLLLSSTASCSEASKDYRLAKRKWHQLEQLSNRLDRARAKRDKQVADQQTRLAKEQEAHPHGAANFDDLSTPASARLELTPQERAQMQTEELEQQQELEEDHRMHSE